jgi:hypothetical protein
LKADSSEKGFLFMRENPHNIPAKRFALKAEMKYRAIVCDSKCGPDFYDIRVSDNCNADTNNALILMAPLPLTSTTPD